MNKVIIFFIVVISHCPCIAQHKLPLSTAVLPLVDSVLPLFTRLDQFAPLWQRSGKTIRKIVKTDRFARREKLFNRLLRKPDASGLVLMTFDYYFRNQQPLPGTDVERYFNIVKEHNLYPRINKAFCYAIPDNPNMRDSIWAKVGWQFGYGYIFYTTPQDSIYLATMRRHSTRAMDRNVISIINHYLQQQEPPFKYDRVSMTNEISRLPGMIDVADDACLTKTLQLPNWDAVYIRYLAQGDTLERKYVLQVGQYRSCRIAKRIKLFSVNKDIVFFKEAQFALHGVEQVKKQCEQNRMEDEKSRKSYEEFMRQKKP